MKPIVFTRRLLSASIHTARLLIHSVPKRRFALLVLLPIMLPITANANEPDPDWPCIQALVPVVEIGVLWPEVLPESDLGQWKSDKRVASMARQLADLREYSDTERQMVEQFVEATPEAEKRSTLNRLAEGTLALANQRRSLYIKGIKKYTRQQTAIALQIEEGLNKLAKLEEENVQSPKRDELAATMDWHQRVFDQREHSMVALCDQPVSVELTTSDILRDLAQYLP